MSNAMHHSSCLMHAESIFLPLHPYTPITFQLSILYHSYPSLSLPIVAFDTQSYKPIHLSTPRTFHAHNHLYPLISLNFSFSSSSSSSFCASFPVIQGVRRFRTLTEGGVHLELTPTTTSPLAINVTESTDIRIQRLISENPVITFSRLSYYICHIMKCLLSTIGVHPTIIELDDEEIGALAAHSAYSTSTAPVTPTVFISSTRVGGLESLMALHLSGHLVPYLAGGGSFLWG
ncbi:glutaredoxin-C6-like [Vitis riparia]|uniref:glutaredoxin-C6-like n=1 Tax=Vitis riparia TaxID=96939 RepID=UPI00155B2FDB|nr:glutaredoxin-C6-like [Vitis riparia]